MQMPITLIKGDKVSSRTDYRDNLPVNMTAVERDILGAKGYMLQYPGLTSFATGIGIDRGGIYNEKFESHYRLSGTSLISVSSSGVVATLGTISGTSQATLEGLYGFNTQGIIADGNMFLYSPSGGLTQITDSDLGNPLDGVWINGYYFLTDGDYIYHTDLDSETAIDPLKFATAEFMADRSLGIGKTRDNKAIVFGRYTTEYFYDAAVSNFAFKRIETRAQKIGIVATHAKAQFNDVWYILGGSKGEGISAHILTSGVSKKISTREIDKRIKEYTEDELSDVRIEYRKEDDILFVLYHLPNETLCYNASIAEKFGNEIAWSILKTDIKGDDPYRGINGVFDPRCSKWIYGDKEDENIGYLNDSVTTHYGEKVEWILYSPFVNLETFSIDELKIETIPGHTSVDDAKVAISLTQDGNSFGKEYWMQYGEPNDYSQSFLLRSLGYVRDWIGFKFRGASESRMAFALMQIEYN